MTVAHGVSCILLRFYTVCPDSNQQLSNYIYFTVFELPFFLYVLVCCKFCFASSSLFDFFGMFSLYSFWLYSRCVHGIYIHLGFWLRVDYRTTTLYVGSELNDRPFHVWVIDAWRRTLPYWAQNSVILIILKTQLNMLCIP